MSSKRKTPARKKTTKSTPSAPVDSVELRAAQPANALAAAPVEASSAPVTEAPSDAACAPKARLSTPVSHEERHRMIAKVAYGYAERAGFRSNPMDDWLMAEREVDARLQLLAS